MKKINQKAQHLIYQVSDRESKIKGKERTFKDQQEPKEKQNYYTHT